MAKDQVPALRRCRVGATFYNIRVYPQITNYVTKGIFDEVYGVNSGLNGVIGKTTAAFGFSSSVKQVISTFGIDLDGDAGQPVPGGVLYLDLNYGSPPNGQAIERALFL